MTLKHAFALIVSVLFASVAYGRCDEWTFAKMQYSVASSNLANLETTRTPEGGAYQKKVLVKLPGDRCAVKSVKAFKSVFEPGHPDADPKGYVKYPDINTIEELNNLTRAREKLKSLEKTRHTASDDSFDSNVDFD